ncbi:MAG: bis(5'-nucleosyl)-tetraphosphatase (symmetrical) YqeK, partial [Clostridia bacterium]|nr:bis(5'-nucleosyl)-tetraphosphatase (symmetrical) YqeK [Clostridia bacterium]
EKQAPKLWHAILGSEYIRRELNDDEEIISAVRYHTTAKPDMTLLEKIIYLADFTSQDRDYNGVDEMRIAVREDLTVAMKEALKFSVADLVSQEKAIHPDTIAAYNQVFMNM